MIRHVEVGWQWLETHLNEIIDALNMQKPLSSGTVAVQETPNGSILSTQKPSAQQPQQQQGGGGGGLPPNGWMHLTWHDRAWIPLTVVDPATCSQSTVKVLAQSPGNSITLNIYFDWSTLDTTTPPPS